MAAGRWSPHEGRVGTSDGEGNGLMGTRIDEAGAEPEDAIPEIRPWCEAGWIFKDGDALAIERQGERARQRSAGADQRQH